MLYQALRQRLGGQLGAVVVIDEPGDLPPSWCSKVDRGTTDGPLASRSSLNVLTDLGRQQLARVADERQHRRSWGAHLVRQWLGRWTEHEQFMDYIEEFPRQQPGLFSGGAQRWERWPTPPVNCGDDRAAKLLHEANFDRALARDRASWCVDQFGECVCGECWRVDLNLRLAPLSVTEAFACWGRG